MGKVWRDEAGFSAIEVVMVLALAGLIGVAAWTAYNNHRAASTASTPAPTSPYTGWHTYTSPDEKFTVRYPAGWRVINEPPDGDLKESMTLLGPNHFDLNYGLVKYDSALTVAKATEQSKAVGNADPLKDNAYTVVTTFTPTGFAQALYVVTNSVDVGERGGPVNSLDLSAYKSYESQPTGNGPYYLAKNNAGYMVQWGGGYDSGGLSAGPVGMPAATFLAKPEVHTATSILKSIRY